MTVAEQREKKKIYMREWLAKNPGYYRSPEQREQRRRYMIQYRAAHPEYSREKCRKHYAKNKERYKAKSRERYAVSDHVVRNQRLKAAYGITVEQYSALSAAQNGVCAICSGKRERRLAVDHDHTTGRVRGLLCDNCNMGLGKFMDSNELLHKAIQYLVKNAH